MNYNIGMLRSISNGSVNNCCNNLKAAQKIISSISFPSDFPYSVSTESIASTVGDICDEASSIKNTILTLASDLEEVDRDNVTLGENAVDDAESLFADIANLFGGFLKGIGEFGEGLIDAGAIFSMAAADAGELVGGEFVPRAPGTRGVTDQQWKDTMAFVADEHVDNTFKKFFENTEKGRWLNAKANSGFKSDGTATNVAAGLGKAAGVVGVSLFTGGAPIVAGLSATGEYTGKYWNEARNSTPAGQEWATEETRNKGIAYGTAKGAWEAAQWYVGGKVNNLAGTGGRVVRVATDTAFNALDTPFKSLVDAYAYDKTFSQAYEDNGGTKAVITDGAIGFIGSFAGEALDNWKKNKNLQTQDDLDTDNLPKLKNGENNGFDADDVDVSTMEYDSEVLIENYMRNIEEYSSKGISIEQYFNDNGVRVIDSKNAMQAAETLGDSKLYMLEIARDKSRKGELTPEGKRLLGIYNNQRSRRRCPIGYAK